MEAEFENLLFAKVIGKFNLTAESIGITRAKMGSKNQLIFETPKGEVHGNMEIEEDHVVVRWGDKEINIPISALLAEPN